MNISGLNKAEVLAALYNGSKVLGLGLLHAKDGLMSISEAQSLLDTGIYYFDYLNGKVMKIDLSSDELDTRLYNRDNGDGSAESIIKELRKGI